MRCIESSLVERMGDRRSPVVAKDRRRVSHWLSGAPSAAPDRSQAQQRHVWRFHLEVGQSVKESGDCRPRTSGGRFRLGALVLMLALAVPASPAHAFTWSAAKQVSVIPPPNAGPTPRAEISTGACPTTSFCIYDGTYVDSGGNQEEMAAIKTGQTWGQEAEIAPPANAASNPEVKLRVLSSLVCTRAGTCIATGTYTNSSSERKTMVAEETSGTWGRAVELALPLTEELSPACPPSGPCVIVANYNLSGQVQAITETAGSWGQPVQIALPANAASKPEPQLSGVACPAAGSCVAVGGYQTGSEQYAPMVFSQTNGTWGQAVQIPPPTGGVRAYLGSVACQAAGSCFAAGSYSTVNLPQPNHGAVVAEETNGTWGQPVGITLPANSSSTGFAGLGTVACPGSGPCVALGRYTTTGGQQEALGATETNGVWGGAVEIKPPANAASSPEETLSAVCPASGSGSCIALGTYQDGSGHAQAMAAEETGGAWSQGTEIAPPANAESNPGMFLGNFGCPGALVCVAAGAYKSGGQMRYWESTGTAPLVTTTTGLAVSNATPAPGETVTYTATVTPEFSAEGMPSGSVQFLDGGTPISTCSSQPLTQGLASSTATCQISYTAAGVHSITASYGGNANYGSSTSTAQTVTIHEASAGGGSTTGGSTNSGGGTQATTGGSASGSTNGKPLTQAQKLAKALAVCRKLKSKHARAKCTTAAKKRYTSSKHKTHRRKTHGKTGKRKS